jgi:hypothetical protein
MSFIILFWIISVVGITHIITGTHIFKTFRQLCERFSPNFFGVLFSCPTCTGFWVGYLLALVFPVIQISEISGYFNTSNSLKIFVLLFLHGSFSSAINWIVNTLITWLDGEITKTEIKNEIMVENPLEVARQLLMDSEKKQVL